MCGIPCFYYSWCRWREYDGWLTRESEVILPGEFNFEFLGKTIFEANRTARFEFQMSGPPHMNVFIQPVGSAEVSDWSFVRKMLDEPEEFEPPYQIYFSYGTDSTPLRFHIDIWVRYFIIFKLKTFYMLLYNRNLMGTSMDPSWKLLEWAILLITILNVMRNLGNSCQTFQTLSMSWNGHQYLNATFSNACVNVIFPQILPINCHS